jgi:hypothetical protein
VYLSGRPSDPTTPGRGVDSESDFERTRDTGEIMRERELQDAPILHRVRLLGEEGQGLVR